VSLSGTAIVRRSIGGMPTPLALLPIPTAVAVAGVMLVGGLHIAEYAVAALAAVLGLVIVMRWPASTLGFLLLFVPLQLAGLSLLFRLGLPRTVVRDLGYLKDIAVLGLLLESVRRGAWARRIDMLDLLALIYLAWATFYLVLPEVVHNAFLPQTFTVRVSAWRLDCLFAVLFLAVRRLDLPARAVERIRHVVLGLAVLLAAFGVWEFVGTGSFNHFMVSTLQLPRYKAFVLGVPYPNPSTVITYGLLGGYRFVRVGSLVNDFHTLAFLMLIPLGLGLERLSARRLSAFEGVATFAAAVALLLSLTRASILGGVLVVALALVLAARRKAPGRIRLVLVVFIGVIAILPVAAQTHVAARLLSLNNTNETDNQAHISRSKAALDALLNQPLGRGLGTNLVTGARYNTAGSLVAEDYYLQVGNELGAPEMIVFVLLLALLLIRLGIASVRAGPAETMAGGLLIAGCGLTVGGFFLHDWGSYEVSLGFFGLAAVALTGRTTTASAQAPP
jgi:hypothetical protein